MNIHDKSADVLKLCFIVGLLFTFVSLFLEWYIVDVFNESGQKLVENTHAILNGWVTIKYLENSVLNQYIPKNTMMSPMLTLIQVFMIVGSIIIALFKNPETASNLETTKSNAYFFLTTSFMITLMITTFPFTILFPNDLFFPGMVLNNMGLSIIINEEIGIGYILQCMGFILTFPYAFFCYKVATTFQQQSKVPNKRVQMQRVKKSVNLDQLIAEEDAFLTAKESIKGQEGVEHQVEIAYQQFQSQRKNGKRVKN